MRIRWKGFELPVKVVLDAESKSDTFGKFVVEPFERGYGITIGNSLRRVLLSSLEGTAPVSLRIEGAAHEFAAISGVREDVINIALNVKGILLAYEGDEPEIIRVEKRGSGPVTAGDFQCGAGVKVLNPDHLVATLADDNTVFKAEIEFRKGRGFVRSEDFSWKPANEIGTVLLDAAFSPIRRARWRVEGTRVGKMTNYDRLILEVWTNGTITPEDALVESATILRKHLNPFVKYYEIGDPLTRDSIAESEIAIVAAPGAPSIDSELREKLNQPVTILDPSVRAANCLAAEGIKTIGDLVAREETEMLQVRNFGKTSLKEIKLKLNEMGLSFGMKV